MDKVSQDWAGRGGFLDHGYRNILQPNGFLPNQPIVCWCGCAGIVPVFANQLPCRVIEKEKLGTQRAIFADALIQSIGFIVVGFAFLTVVESLPAAFQVKVVAPSFNGFPVAS